MATMSPALSGPIRGVVGERPVKHLLETPRQVQRLAAKAAAERDPYARATILQQRDRLIRTLRSRLQIIR